MSERCFACDKRLTERIGQAITGDGAQVVKVGADCAMKIYKAGTDGYQPPKGGPRLYVIGKQPKGGVEHRPDCICKGRGWYLERFSNSHRTACTGG